ncbi:hypothetical protein JHK87_055878 [Glycine soja]|nr:hypothetical protein JHK87_055878 [Glycine soja]
MVADIPLGWKPLNLEQYDGTTDPDEHLDAFLTQVNLYTNDDSILCHLFPTSLKGATLTCLPHADDESLRKFIDKFGRTVVQIQNLNHEVALHSMLLTLCPRKFIDSLCEKPLDSMDELRQRVKGYIQMEEMSRFRNEVRQAGQKHDKCEAQTKTDAHKSDNRHNLDKCQPLFKGHRYECYTRLTANHATILEEAFNLEDFKGINTVNQDDLVVVSIVIANFMVSRVLIDQGKRVETRGYGDLMTTFSQGKISRSFTIRYLLVDANTS